MLEGPVLECVRTDIALTLLSNVTFSDITMNYLEDPLRPTETDPGCGTTSLRLKKTHLVYSFEMFSWKELPGNYLCSRAGVFGFNEHGLMNISEAFEYLENKLPKENNIFISDPTFINHSEISNLPLNERPNLELIK